MSRDVAPDVDGWIAQAKKLQTDIERSKATARDIVQQAEAGKKLRSEAEEAANKTGLLEKEVSFNKALVETLSQVRNIRQTLDDCQNAMVQGDLSSALAAIKQVGVDLPSLAAVENTRAYDLISKRDEGLKSALAEQAAERARNLVDVKTGERRLTIFEDGAGKCTKSHDRKLADPSRWQPRYRVRHRCAFTLGRTYKLPSKTKTRS